ncbi:MAG: ABC transporter ATP-binding protein [Euryarchaeota archaeon]|nr:ABC transporter ATP-binding protein [Euryarchaeota archaeon]
MLSIRNLSKNFGGVAALHRCSFEVKENSICGLIGPNGSGKTTLFNLITGIYKCDCGDVYLKGEELTHLKPHEVARRGVGRTFQITKVFTKMTALENLLVAASKTGREVEEKALELLDFVNLLELRDEYAGNLSFGQQKLLELARVLMLEPELLLLDEALAGINPTMKLRLLELIRHLQKQGKTFLIIEHDMKAIMPLCEKLVVLDHGEKIAEGLPEDIQRNERVMEAYFGAIKC